MDLQYFYDRRKKNRVKSYCAVDTQRTIKKTAFEELEKRCDNYRARMFRLFNALRNSKLWREDHVRTIEIIRRSRLAGGHLLPDRGTNIVCDRHLKFISPTEFEKNNVTEDYDIFMVKDLDDFESNILRFLLGKTQGFWSYRWQGSCYYFVWFLNRNDSLMFKLKASEYGCVVKRIKRREKYCEEIPNGVK